MFPLKYSNTGNINTVCFFLASRESRLKLKTWWMPFSKKCLFTDIGTWQYGPSAVSASLAFCCLCFVARWRPLVTHCHDLKSLSPQLIFVLPAMPLLKSEQFFFLEEIVMWIRLYSDYTVFLWTLALDLIVTIPCVCHLKKWRWWKKYVFTFII